MGGWWEVELTEAEQSAEGPGIPEAAQLSGEVWPRPLIIEMTRVMDDEAPAWRITTCDTETEEHSVMTLPYERGGFLPGFWMAQSDGPGLAEPINAIPEFVRRLTVAAWHQRRRLHAAAAGSLVATLEVPSHPSHHLLRIPAFHISDELLSGGIAKRRRMAAVVADLDSRAAHRECKAARRSRHRSDHALLTGGTRPQPDGRDRSTVRVTR